MLSAPTPLPAPPEAPRSEPGRAATSRRTMWLLGGAALAGCAYVAVVDPNRSSLYPQCPFRMITGLDCPGCGMTRAVHSLLHGDLVAAASHNLLMVVTAVIALAWFAFARVQRMRGQEPPRFRLSGVTVVPLTIVVLAFWVLRNLPMQPFHWLGSGA